MWSASTERNPQDTGSSKPTSLHKRSPSEPHRTSGTALDTNNNPSMSYTNTDRVFPIRSIVSLDPAASPTPKIEKQVVADGDGFPGFAPSRKPEAEQKLDMRHISIKSDKSDESASNLVKSDLPDMHREDSASQTPSTQNGPDDITERGAKIRQSVGEESQATEGLSEVRSITDTSPARSSGLPSQGADDFKSQVGSFKNIQDDANRLVTARFKHVVTAEGHAVITGRDGNTIQRCEDEPIHIPGAVQGFGLLVALQEVDDGRLQVRVVSENSKRIIGYTPKQLFELESFSDILSDEQTDNLLDHIDFIKDEDADPATHGPEVFTIAIRSPSKKTSKMWCAMHINGHHRDLIICEFELEDDPVNPLVPVGDATPEPPENTLNSAPTSEEYHESTVNTSKPLRILRSARSRRGEAAAMEVFNVMSQVQEQLGNAPNLDQFLKILVGVVKELTGFHRVMIYQFDESWNGRVVTELVDPRATKDLYKGLNFPASDIPKQARDMYKLNKVRLLYDRDQETARLVCRTIEDLENPLDLTFSYLRAMSPIHIKYLSHMAVRASMSISINAFNELWGLIACHSYGSKGMRVSFPIRKMCRLVGDSASRNIERLSYAARLQARKLINTVPTESNPSGYIIASSEDLLTLFAADYGVLSIRGEAKMLGKIPQTQEALALVEYFRLRKISSVYSSIDISKDFPDLRYPPGFSIIAGLLLVPLTANAADFIVFFRKGQVREVKWAGNPYEKFVKEGTEGYLEPRKSFQTWSETITGKCGDWTEEQIETAAVLCLVYGKFIEVWRQKEAALQNSQLTKLLLANSAHEVRTPLNAIINYLEIALEGTIDQETRENLSRSHSASKSLIYVINDLLDLTKTEEGHELIRDEIFDLPATVKEAADCFIGDAKRKNIGFETIEHPGVPQLVVGDQRRVRQAVSNITANAIKYTVSGAVKVEMWLSNKTDNHVEVDIVVQDTGCGMTSEKLDALFQELEQVQTQLDENLEGHFATTKSIEGKGGSERTLGLGLALVARIVRNTNGQLRLKSEEGIGSRFTIQMGFNLPTAKEENQRLSEHAKAAGLAPPAGHPSTPPVQTGEVVLVNKSAQKPRPETSREISHRASIESLESIKSFKAVSSVRSDVNRLIGAFQEPYGSSKTASQDVEAVLTPTKTRGRGRPGSSSGSRIPVSEPSRQNSLSMSNKSSEAGRVQPEEPGTLPVTDSKTPLKPIRMPEEETTGSSTFEHPLSSQSSRVIIGTQNDLPKTEVPLNADHLQALIAEDDPINSKIIRKRLEKLGHHVYLTINGEECSSTYGDTPVFFDVVLMDMQMPIVDGLTSTKMIRSFEKTHANVLSRRAACNGRVPIFAVSASLLEKERQTYVDAGFDGWILKPVDFQRLSVLLSGIVNVDVRERCFYAPGHWERGGWFCRKQPPGFASKTTPSPTAVVSSQVPLETHLTHAKDDGTDQERERLQKLDNDAVHAKSIPLGSSHAENLKTSNESNNPG